VFKEVPKRLYQITTSFTPMYLALWLLTPQIAWATHAARERLLKIAVNNVASLLEGMPQNVVNGVKVTA
jgi:lactate dehydrogenase-like 2-hydroxyacid dehydrogenase